MNVLGKEWSNGTSRIEDKEKSASGVCVFVNIREKKANKRAWREERRELNGSAGDGERKISEKSRCRE